MTFNGDSRWLAITTDHGTTHLFLINPYGGLPHAASHLEARVVNGAYATQSTSLGTAVRFRRKQPEVTEDVDTEQAREDNVSASHFLPASENLSRWLSKLPPSYDLPPTSASASSIMLTVDSEGVLKLLRITVSKKAPAPNSTASQDLALSTQVDSIADWTLAKLPNDVEKWLSAAQELTYIDESTSTSSLWEPESAWLPFVETRSYDPFVCPSRPLWTLRQFEFKEYCEEENIVRALGSECFTKDQRKTRVLAVRHKNMSGAQGIPSRKDYNFQPSSSYGDIEGHLVHAMETKLDRPTMPKRLPQKKEALSFEDALEIHMVHPMRQVSEKTAMTEIPLSYLEEEDEYNGQSADDMDSDHLGVFTMDELDDGEYEASVESDHVVLHSVDHRLHREAVTNSHSSLEGCHPIPGSPEPSKFSVDSFLALTSSTEDI
ncbi:Breast carcinoma amplified sequence 3 [Entomophthora muscae]|uniref:Breast carcinoma amplified sequence 3 n=1 Tax=Entomophthora muscae TaxID=34485 RepID=A0ACC2STF4_9FUNG|nr:Breast carcinoma amplified sequence 3 [Entomophthora muscae]